MQESNSIGIGKPTEYTLIVDRLAASLSVKRALVVAVQLFALVITPSLYGDDSRPALIEIRELVENTYSLRWSFPPRATVGGEPRILLSEPCSQINQAPEVLARGARFRQFQCPEDIAGLTLVIEFPGAAPSFHTVVRMVRLTGEEYTGVLAPGEREWQVPARETLASVTWDYLGYGVVHIFKGVDHLLFVLCLIWIAGTWQRILLTITGFTIAHSITLALSALDLIRLAVPPVEAGIALSVAFLASEVVRGERPSLTWRFPASIAAAFGLVHGLGFASVLRDIGLPQTQVLAGLVSFNLGVEIGQVLFALPVAGAVAVLRHYGWQVDLIRQAMGYCIGALAAFWVFERVSGSFV